MDGQTGTTVRDDVCLDEDGLIRYLAGDLGDEEEQLVRVHIGRCDACRTAVAEEARGEAPSEPVSGDTIEGKFLVEKKIGGGGMGVVFAAKHIDLGRSVAVKILSRDRVDDPESVARFVREMRVVSQLASDHVVEILDVGTMRDGTPYMAMELLTGRDLAQHANAVGVLEPDVAVGYVLEACLGLRAVHDAGIVHRDIKLANLFLAERQDGRTIVKILDFGLCKGGAPTAGETSLTHVDAMMGTPHYMSPEQFVSTRDVGPATDVWSLGVCLYRLLTGRLPFEGETVTQLCARVLGKPPPSPRSIRPNVPEDVDAVVMRCLARDPADRYHDARELVDALARLADPDDVVTDEVTDPLVVARMPAQALVPQVTLAMPRGRQVTTARTTPRSTSSTYLFALFLFGGVLLLVGVVVAASSRTRPTQPVESVTPPPAATTEALPTAPPPTPSAPLPQIVQPAPPPKPHALKPARPPPRPHPSGAASSKDRLYDQY